MNKSNPLVISVVVNTCYGGFSLSQKAAEAVLKRKGLKYRLEKVYGDTYHPVIGDGWQTVMDICPRHDPDLVAVVREMGQAADGECAQLKIIDFVIEIDISSYDGKETAKLSGVQQ